MLFAQRSAVGLLDERGAGADIRRVIFFVTTFTLIFLDKLLKDHGYIEFASQNLPGGKQLFPDYIIPITTMIVLTAILVILVRVIFRGNARDQMIAVWTGFVCVYLVLTVVGTSFRGPGMDMYAPWALPATHQCFAP